MDMVLRICRGLFALRWIFFGLSEGFSLVHGLSWFFLLFLYIGWGSGGGGGSGAFSCRAPSSLGFRLVFFRFTGFLLLSFCSPFSVA
jgi:hypothetical protein